MKFDEIIYTIKKLAEGGGITSDDSRLNPRQINAWISYYRSKLMYDLREKIKKDNSLDQYVQDLGCVKLICVDKADCCDGSYKIYDYYKKLEKPLPKLLGMIGSRSLYFVGLIDKITSIPIGTSLKARYQQYDEYTKERRFCFLVRNQIYFLLPKYDDLEVVNIRGIFEDPDLAANYNCGTDNPLGCEDGESEYPMPGYLIQPMRASIMKNELNITVATRMLNDNVNDGRQEKPQIPSQQTK